MLNIINSAKSSGNTSKSNLLNRSSFKEDMNRVEPNAFYCAIVEDTHDPYNLCRVRVRVPSIHGLNETQSYYLKTSSLPWAKPACLPGAGNDVGSLLVPTCGTRVFVTFELNDLNKPIYFGGIPATLGNEYKYYNDNNEVLSGESVEIDSNDTISDIDGKAYQVLYKSLKGSTILINDKDGEESLKIIDAAGQQIIMKNTSEEALPRRGNSVNPPETASIDIISNGNININGKNINLNGDAEVAGDLNVTGVVSGVATGDTVPIGAGMWYPSDTIPDNWLLCNGQAVSRTTYADLFTILGTTHGSGDGSTTFNVPNIKSRTIVGKDSSDTDFDTLGETYGEKTHTLDTTEIPSHTHDVWANSFAGNLAIGMYSGSDGSADGSIYGVADFPHDNNRTGYKLYAKSVGGGLAHNNIQPSIVENYIIKAKQSAGLVATVVDGLTSTSTTNALSANQGRILNNLVTTYTQSGSAANFTISNLDFDSNPSGWIIEFRGESSGIGIIGININGTSAISDGAMYETTKTGDSTGGMTIGGYYYKNNCIHIARFNDANGGVSRGTVFIVRPKGAGTYPSFKSQCLSKGTDMVGRNMDGVINTNDNITSLYFFAENGNLSNCAIKIFKI